MNTCEEDFRPWNNGFLYTGNMPGTSGGTSNRTFVHKLNAVGDTIWTREYPSSLVNSWTVKLEPSATGFALLGFGNVNGGANYPHHYTLLRTDTAGTVLGAHSYANPNFYGNAYPYELLPTARGGYLLAGQVQDSASFRPFLIETDAQGQELRRRLLVLRRRSETVTLGRTYHNALRLRDGSGYLLGGVFDSLNGPHGIRSLLIKLDTALNVQWLYTRRSPRTACVTMGRVRELADGSFEYLSGDADAQGRVATPYLRVVHVSAQGQYLGQREFRTQYSYVRSWDWQPLPDSSLVVVGAAWANNRDNAYIGRFGPARVLGTAAGQGRREPLVCYPNPSSGAAQRVQVQVPEGAGSTLAVFDALGRVLHTQAVARGAVEVSVPVAALPPGLYVLRLTASDGRAYTSRLLRQ